MSLVQRGVSPRQVAANQSNAQKSTGPKTPEGKARASQNAFKTGAYAKGSNALRQILPRSREDPQEQEQLYQDLLESWQPDDTMQAILVQTIADKTWDMLQLRGLRRESQLTALQISQIQDQRQTLQERRSKAKTRRRARGQVTMKRLLVARWPLKTPRKVKRSRQVVYNQ
ncbi:MAG TPA: hypothetical protein VKM93_19530 [Terriglobia bacterium]|nr:hypothetical protein [Terriglobia bacterium]